MAVLCRLQTDGTMWWSVFRLNGRQNTVETLFLKPHSNVRTFWRTEIVMWCQAVAATSAVDGSSRTHTHAAVIFFFFLAFFERIWIRNRRSKFHHPFIFLRRLRFCEMHWRNRVTSIWSDAMAKRRAHRYNYILPFVWCDVNSHFIRINRKYNEKINCKFNANKSNNNNCSK